MGVGVGGGVGGCYFGAKAAVNFSSDPRHGASAAAQDQARDQKKRHRGLSFAFHKDRGDEQEKAGGEDIGEDGPKLLEGRQHP